MQIIKNRKWFYIFSSIIIIAGIISMFVQGFNLGIDFEGGSLVRYKINGSVSADQVRATLSDLEIIKEVNVQKSDNEFFIRTNELDQKATAQMTAALKEQFKKLSNCRVRSVGYHISS